VVNAGVDAVDYAAHLLGIVGTARTGDRRWRNALAVVRPSQLEQRFAALLAVAGNRHPVSHRRLGVVGTVTAAFVVPLAAAGSPLLDGTIRVHTGSLPATLDTLTAADRAAPSAVRSTRAVDFPASQSVIAPEVIEYTTPPLYSEEARRRRIEGIVSIEARIDLEGRANQARVVRGLGSGLDENALVALRQWRFRPGTQEGRALEMIAEVDIEFNLRNEALNELIANDMATRIGSGVTPPRIVRAVSVPRQEGRDERIAGTVALDVVLLEDGTPKIVRVLQSLTPSLDERAIEVFEQWRFSPALRDGRAVKVRLQADITFR
jgi:TonB family protein